VPTLSILIFIAVMGAPADEVADPSAPDCLSCHGEQSLSRTGPKQQQISLHVDKKRFARSVHGDLGCAVCHPGFTGENHLGGEKRGTLNKIGQTCSSCHDVKSGLHGRMLKRPSAPSCADCHGDHGIGPVKRGGCEGCHSQPHAWRLKSGEKIELQVDRKALRRSVHRGLSCRNCHQGYSSQHHPALPRTSRRQRTRAMNTACRQCHHQVYDLTREGVHQNVAERHPERRPVCSDCHGAHDVIPAAQAPARGARRCRSCHEKVFSTYANSVHGAALTEHENADVPTCADCHRAHDIRNPGIDRYRSHIPQLCGNCHSDRKRMARYDLSPNVVQSYLDDFHGVTLSFYAKEDRSVRKIAVCVDCHGVHDIQSTRGAHRKAIKQRLLERCRGCHPNATAAFPDAWVSHWIPGPKRASIVYWIQWFYWIVIPLMLIGLGLQVLLHFWRYVVRR
jgi:hypothetical protein